MTYLPADEEYFPRNVRSRKWTQREHYVDNLITHQCADYEYQIMQQYDRAGFVEQIVDEIDENGLTFNRANVLDMFYELLYL
jgi:hypothetical protein